MSVKRIALATGSPFGLGYCILEVVEYDRLEPKHRFERRM